MEDEKKSIIGSKYQDRYKEKDWLGNFIDGNATDPVTREKKTKVKDEAGNETVTVETVDTGKRKLNLDNFFALARANSIDTAAMEDQRERPNAPGRIRMTLGNSLRAAARHRHGLYDMAGEWVEAPADWLGDAVRTQHPDGSKIVTANVETPSAAGADEEAVAEAE